MNAEEAKMILQCRRPRGQDDVDPAMSEALALIRDYPPAWDALGREEALDAIIGMKLRSVDPPANLLQNILLGAKITRPIRGWRRPAWLSFAAALVIGIPAAWKYWPEAAVPRPLFAAATFADFRADTTQKLNTGVHLKAIANFDDVKAHLAANSQTKSLPVPDGLCHCAGGTVGCEVFVWRGKEVTLICFNAGKAGTVHLFTVDASALEDRPGGPVYVTSNGWNTMSWTQGGKLMVLAGEEKRASRKDLEKLLADNG